MSLIACSRCFFRLVRLLLLLALNSVGTFLCAQTLEFKLIDGRNGHPITNTCINAWVGGAQRDALAIPTDKDGVARLRLTDVDAEVNTHDRWKNCGEFGVINPVVKYEDSVSVNVSYVVCEPHGTDFSWLEVKRISTREVMQRGVMTANTCGKPTAPPTPRQITIFVRPLNFWERLKQ